MDKGNGRKRRRRHSRPLAEAHLDESAPVSARRRERVHARRQLRRARRVRIGAALGAAALALVTAVVWLAGLSPGSTGEDYEKALARFRAGDYRAAVDGLNAALDADPHDLSSRILVGKAYLAMGQAADAEDALRQALSDGADEAVVLAPLANAYLQQGRYRDLLQAIPADAGDTALRSRLLVVRGRALLQMREFDRAADAFDTARRLNPDTGGPLLGQASLLVARREFDAALRFTDEAADLAPENPHVWFVKGEIDRLRGNPEPAIVFYDRALSIDANFVEARLARAGVLVEIDRDQEALADLRHVWSVRDDEPQADYLYALILSKLGEIDRAQQVLERAAVGLSRYRTEYLMQHAPSLLLLGVIHFKNGNYDEAFPLIDRFVQLEPRHAGARKMAGTILLMRGLPSVAVETMEPLLRTHPNDPELLALLSQGYLETKQPERARALLERAATMSATREEVRSQLALTRLVTERAGVGFDGFEATLALDEGSENAAVLLGLLQLRQGNLEIARETADTLLARQPDSASAHDLAGAVLLARGDAAAARRSFERAAEIDPGYATAQYNLAGLDVKAGHDEAARARYLAILDARPSQTVAMVALSRLDRKRGRVEDALAWLERARQADPKSLVPQLDLVDLYLEADRFDEALALVAELDEAFPGSIPVRIARGRVEYASGDHEKASATFRALSSDTESLPDRLYRVAEYQLASDDLAGARASLARLLEHHPGYVPGQLLQIDLLLREDKVDLALGHARQLQHEAPRDPHGYRSAGDILRRMERPDEAARTLEEGLEVTGDPGLAAALYEVRATLGQQEQALGELRSWAETHGENAEIRRTLADANLALGRHEEARAQYESLIGEQPDDPALLANLARVYHRDGDARAIEYAERAYRIAPKEALTLDTLGWILVNGDDPKRGLKLLRDASNRASREPRVRYHVAAALARLGRTDEARRELQRTLAEGRQFEGLADARALLESLEAD